MAHTGKYNPDMQKIPSHKNRPAVKSARRLKHIF